MNSWHIGNVPKIKKSSKLIRYILLAMILVSFFQSPPAARADVGPVNFPGGAIIFPGDELTQVRMVAETITLDFARPDLEYSSEASVTADFTMRNLGDITEQLVVGFPLTCSGCLEWGAGGIMYPIKIDDLSVFINTLQVATREETISTPYYLNNHPSSWAVFDMAFPPGQDVYIRITYTGRGWGFSPFMDFTYTLVTGAAWYDTIGSLDIIARFPYPVNDQNTDLEYDVWEETTPGATISGNELLWHFENLEPDQDFHLRTIYPGLWQSMLVEEENVSINPDDGEAWGRLGLAYKNMILLHRGIRTDPLGLTFYMQSIEAYQRATTLLPGDAMWHAGFADLLFQHFYWTEVFPPYGEHQPEDLSEILRAINEIRLSLDIDPNNELALNLVRDVNEVFPGAILSADGRIGFPMLTSTAGINMVLNPTSRPPQFTRVPTIPVTHFPRTATSSAAVTTSTQAAPTPFPIYDLPASPVPSTSIKPDSPSTTTLLLIAIPVTVVLLLGVGWLLRRNRP